MKMVLKNYTYSGRGGGEEKERGSIKRGEERR